MPSMELFSELVGKKISVGKLYKKISREKPPGRSEKPMPVLMKCEEARHLYRSYARHSLF